MSKQILKVTRTKAVVKIVSSAGNETIDVSELAYFDQIVDVPNVKLPITTILYNTAGSANVVRNGNVIFSMTQGYNEHNFHQTIGVNLHDDADGNVVVNFGTGENTVILQFSKEAGYIDPEQQSLYPRDK